VDTYSPDSGNANRNIPRLVPVMVGGICAGHLINLGPRGIEGFDRNERSLGVFTSVIEASAAVERSASPTCARCGE
jgi:hypothetical protein